MINTKKIFRTSILFLIAAVAVFGQATTTSTTLSAAVSATDGVFCVASATGISVPSVGNVGTYLVVDAEAAQVVSLRSTLCFNVKRGQLGTSVTAHNSGAVVWVGNAATGTGDSSRPFSSGAIVTTMPTGPCVATAQFSLPIIVVGPQTAGYVMTCTGGYWGRPGSFYVLPTSCAFFGTTSTVTNTFPLVGASNVFVLNGTTNAAAGTTTLSCNIEIPTDVGISNGAFLTDITLFVGSQTTAPTSLGTAALGSITFPAAASSETPSTVTPVAVGGTVTTTSPSQITTVTTAGSFLTLRHTWATPVRFSTDLQILQYTMPFLQGAAAVMTLNTPGILVHYVQPAIAR